MESLAVFVFCLVISGSSLVLALNCALVDQRDRVPCMLSNPNISSCMGMGCCWSGGSADPRMKCYTKKGGKCIKYEGASCKVMLNTTLLPYRETPRFIDNKLGVMVTERFLQLVQGVIQEYVNDDKECSQILATMLCHYTLPPCKPDGTIRPFCQEDCIAIFKRCQKPLNEIIGAVKYISSSKNINFIHTGFPNCSKYKPSSHYDMASNDSCVQTGYFDFRKNPGKEEGISILAIVLPIVVIIIIFLTAIIIILWMRYKHRQDAMVNGKLVLGEGALTMREKLRADSMKSLDTRMLRLYDPNKLKHYPLDNVEYLKDLGEGHFGKVFQGRAVGILAGQPKKEILVAVKALKEGSSKELKDEFYAEVALMSIFSHPNIVSLIAVSTEEEPYGMIFEYMTEGDLNHFVRMAKPAETNVKAGPNEANVFLTQEDMVHIAEQVAAGMEEVANLKFVHRDLATRNCLVGKNMVIKIGDFGMSRDIYQSDYYKMSRETLLPIRWLAPEAFLYGKFTIMSDVYSYGVVLWEVYTFGLQPYYGYTNKEVTEFIKKGVHLGQPDDCPDFIYNIMKDCWATAPSDRPGFGLIQKRLRDPYGNYDVPKSLSNSLDDIDDGSQSFGNYDVPRAPTDQVESGAYDVPKSPSPSDKGDEPGNYDVPKSPEKIPLTDTKDDKPQIAPNPVNNKSSYSTQNSIEI